MKRKLTRQEQESLDNKIVFSSTAIFLYALLLAFTQRMELSPATVLGAQAFIEILWWVALAGSMICACWGAYKEKRSFFFYCGACVFVFLSTTVLRFCTERSSTAPYTINYFALIAMFAIIQAYYFLKSRKLLDTKWIRVAFLVACGVTLLAFTVVSVLHVNRVYLMFIK